jgi:outer membrane immunogenic protein
MGWDRTIGSSLSGSGDEVASGFIELTVKEPKMKKTNFVAAAMALAFSVGPAFAGGLPSYKGPPPAYVPPPPPPMWTGFYVGLNAGGTWGDSNNVTTSASPFYWYSGTSWVSEAVVSSMLASGHDSVNNSGFIGGGQIGYNWQFANTFVAGVEADIQGVAGAGSSAASSGIGVPWYYPTEAILSARSVSGRLDYLGTVRGRIGYLVTPTLLVYGTAASPMAA